jgi:hypothetical protein
MSARDEVGAVALEKSYEGIFAEKCASAATTAAGSAIIRKKVT